MKKFMVLAVALALLVPASAFAATEFSLGGFIKLNTFWDSTQNGSNLTSPVARDNNVADEHGRLNMKAQETRFNFTIKGPKLWGAQTTGFIEMDFDGTSDDATVSSSGTWLARLRLAMFRLNWPETELMMGQYHSILAKWQLDAAESNAFQMTGTVTARLPQIRLTQKFAGDWSVAGMLGLPNNANLTSSAPYSTTTNNGSATETPQLQGMVSYEHDWWGKAAYFGVPKAFTAQVTAGWQRAVNRNFRCSRRRYADLWSRRLCSRWRTSGQPSGCQSLDAAGDLVIPVIPTHSANLAGTASLLTQWFVGQGVEAFGVAGNSSNLYTFHPVSGFYEDVCLLNRFGGFVEAEYYFTNQWYLNAAVGITKVLWGEPGLGLPL